MNPISTLPTGPLPPLTPPAGYPEGTQVYAVTYRYDGRRCTNRVVVGPVSNHLTAFEDIRRILVTRLTGTQDVAAITVESLVLL